MGTRHRSRRRDFGFFSSGGGRHAKIAAMKSESRKTEGKATNRLEALTDSAFAFALTLLVIASGPPRSFDELAQALKTIPAFFASATLLMVFWHGHVKWSRRYGLDDAKSVILTCVLTFTVMVYVYPLRLVSAAFFHWVTRGFLNANLTSFKIGDVKMIFLVYGCGFVAMCGTMVLLYRHAAEKTAELGLGPLDRFDAQSHARTYLILAGSGILSILICLLPGDLGPVAGWAYMPLAFVMPWWGKRSERERQRLAATLAAVDAGEAGASPIRES